jgi:hypothetical protein
MKELDYNPLLYEDKRQSSRALRAYAENTPLGPEVILATPLFDGMDFLGVVAANFDMRNLMTHSSNADSLVVLTPMALLWPGKYDYAATPLAKVDWDLATRRSSSGTCSNDTGTFYYIVRYLANLPMVFAVPSKGTFPDGDGNVNQGLPFFPKEVEKLPPPKLENTPKGNITPADMLKESPDETAVTPAPAPAPAPAATATPMPMSRTEQRRLSGAAGKDIQPGSRESVLLRGKSPTKRRQMEERDLEGENVPVERAPRRRTRQASEPEEDAAPPTQFRRPSPFGSSSDDQSSQPDPQGADRLASPPEDEAQTPDETGSSGQRSGLPRRPSPFGGGSQ